MHQLEMRETSQSGQSWLVRDSRDVKIVKDNIDFFIYNPEACEGIPLNEEWLAKLGYEETTADWWINKEAGVSICITTIPNRLFLRNERKDIVIEKDLPFVHLFQNFVFNYSGVELSIKELSH